MTEQEKEAYRAGYEAFHSPEPTPNPFNPKQDQYEAWEKGWQDAEDGNARQY